MGIKPTPMTKTMQNDFWVNRYEVKGTSGKTYTVAVNRDGGWGCSCLAWTTQKKINGPRKDCQHILSKKFELNGAIANAQGLGKTKVEDITSTRSITLEE